MVKDIQNSLDFSYAKLNSRNPHTITTNMTSRFCVCPWYYRFIGYFRHQLLPEKNGKNDFIWFSENHLGM